MPRRLALLLTLVWLVACSPAPAAEASLPAATAPRRVSPTPVPPTPSLTPSPSPSPTPSPTPSPSPTPKPLVPHFDHIVLILLENKEFGTVMGNPNAPYFNRLALENTLLSQYYAVTHPSLPNYLALVGGDTFGITYNCQNCPVDAPSLPDLLEAWGLSWKTYQESMPEPCYLGSRWPYAQKHNPFIYFTPIRENTARCQAHIVPLTQLEQDIAAGQLPNYIFITPNECNDAHDCPLATADAWLQTWLPPLRAALEAESDRWLIVLTWDEGQGAHSCCNLPPEAGGRVATVLISPLAQAGLVDDTPYTHYSLLKTISVSWGLPPLGRAAEAETPLIVAPWR